LNWDFTNLTGVNVNDLDIIVDNENFSPNLNDPKEVWSAPFPNVALSYGYFDGDGDLDTKITYSGAVILPGQVAHGGLYMKGSGLVLDAYWTWDGLKVGKSTAITYERTEIRGDPEVHMHLQIAPGYFKDPDNPAYPYAEAGWTNIRTFVNIPADLLDLPDLTRSLNLDSLAQYEVTPYKGVPGLPGSSGIEILKTDHISAVPDSFFDVFLAVIPPENANPGFESLLHAEVWNQGAVIGEFWNLNPQSPEPATLSLLALGGLALLRRRRK
jgi:hypothetical protein